MTKKILITGSSGMLGKDIISEMSYTNRYEIYGMDLISNPKFAGTKEFIADITDPKQLNQIIGKVQPNVIIHVAAIVNLSTCEKNKALADAVHINATANLAMYCNKYAAKLIYISTDSVFDGRNGNYKENSTPKPLNYYALSKLRGEEKTAASKQHLIIRTNIYGVNAPLKNSLAEWAIKSWKLNQVISGFDNVYFNALYTKQLARIIVKVIDINISNGVLNIAQKEYISKYQFLKTLNKTLNFSSDLLIPAQSGGEDTIKRPANTTLDITLLSGYIEPPTLMEGMKLLREDYNLISNNE